jgi:hypothetical protein
MAYLVASPTVPTKQHVLDHIVHAINVFGENFVAKINQGLGQSDLALLV